MATISLLEAESVKTLHDGPVCIVNFPEASGQSFKRGEFVNLVSGKVTVGTATSNTFLGMALHNASGTVDTNVQVALATADTVFCANLKSGRTSAVTMRGKSFGFSVTSNKWFIDDTVEGANARALIIDLDSRDVVGDTNGRLHFILLGKFLQFGVTS